jgi:hypothetical protein
MDRPYTDKERLCIVSNKRVAKVSLKKKKKKKTITPLNLEGCVDTKIKWHFICIRLVGNIATL